MAYDYSLLLDKIRRKCKSQAVFAAMMKLSERTVSMKLNNKKQWKQSEIEQACKILEIDRSDIHNFFYQLSSNN